MATRTVFQFSPSKKVAAASPQRAKKPSPEKKSLPYTTLILPPKRSLSSSESSSPTKKSKTADDKDVTQFEVDLDSVDLNFDHSLSLSKRIQLPYSLVNFGLATLPPSGDFSEIHKLFPSSFAIEVCPPFLIVLMDNLPTKPWPLTIGGLPVHFTTSKDDEPFKKGQLGRGPRALTHLDLHKSSINISEEVLNQAASVFPKLGVKVKDLFWFGGLWQVTMPENSDIQTVPRSIAGSPVYYRPISECPALDPAVLERNPPQGTDFDDTDYQSTTDALLRPGVMLGSSLYEVEKDGNIEHVYKSTSSGILVQDQYNQKFITVATHGFQQDHLVYHPNPTTGTVIGEIIEDLEGTDISIARLAPGLRYVNETFGSGNKPDGIQITGINGGIPPNLHINDDLRMNNPFSGSCEGNVFAIGVMFKEEPNLRYIRHQWNIFENMDEPVEGSCGTPILDDDGKVVSFFRLKHPGSQLYWAVSASELGKYGYTIYDGMHTFL
ncbi:MAG: hypothetical protein Q9166_001114 [cf. Caloplaca sp. 2 TL-2023]